MLLRHITNALKAQNWATALVEVLIVVVGIFIGLQVDDWNEARKERAEERVYLEELLEDFEANRTALAQSTTQFENIITAMTALLEQSAMDTPDLPVAQLNNAFRHIHRMPTFISVVRAYTNLTGSGDLKLIRNRQLKNLLAQYYAAADLAVLVQSTHEMELVQTFQPYVIENMDSQAVRYQRIQDFPLPPAVEESRILEVLPTRQFRNILTQKWTISTDLLNQNRDMQTRTSEVIRILEAEIGMTEGGENTQ